MRSNITVIVPTIPPRATMLARAFHSIQEQTLAPDCIIIETDVAKEGPAAVRNRALSKVQTEWVAFLDDDDEMLPNHLKTLMMHQETTGADLIYPWFFVVGGQDPFQPPRGGIPVNGEIKSPFGVPFGDEQRDYLLNVGNFIPVTVLVRTSLLRAVGGFWNVECEEWDLQKKLLRAGATFAHVPQITWHWFHHSSNTSGLPTRW